MGVASPTDQASTGRQRDQTVRRRRKWVASEEHCDWSLKCGDVTFQISVDEEEVRG
jgi:hypothetical protein